MSSDERAAIQGSDAEQRTGVGERAAFGAADRDQERERLTLGDLTEAADVSVRTVRYYIAEGLLPPPEGAGPASSYGAGHVDRLRLIQRLKAAYLPLKEIRRRLSGLDDAEVHALLATEEQWPPLRAEHSDPSLAGAREYLSLLESPAHYRTEPLALHFSPPPASPASSPPEPEPAAQPTPMRSPQMAAGIPERRAPTRHDTEGQAASPLWHRLPLGEEAELVISERVYARHRDRVDWLVRWARKVFG
jgi:DNA-binding transcriptional MerR regulator